MVLAIEHSHSQLAARAWRNQAWVLLRLFLFRMPLAVRRPTGVAGKALSQSAGK